MIVVDPPPPTDDEKQRMLNRTENYTYGIDLSKDWTNSTLNLVETLRPSDAVALASQSLWFDHSQNIIYCFGGGSSFATAALRELEAPTPSIWGFKLNDKGTADWYQVMGPVSSTPFPSDIHHISSGMSTFDENRAYYLGGVGSPSGDPTPSPGLLMFDFNTLKFTNSSDGNYLAPETSLHRWPRGAMINVSTYGDDGILVILPSGRDRQDFAFNNITLYDKKNRSWYSQIASGDIPPPRSYFCAVGVGGDKNNTFEM